MNEPTNYVEANIVLAVQNDQLAHAVRLIKQLLPNEMEALARACRQTAILLEGVAELINATSDPVPEGLDDENLRTWQEQRCPYCHGYSCPKDGCLNGEVPQ